MIQRLKPLRPLLATSVIAGLILSVLAPYGTFTMSFIARVSFWVGLCIAGGLGAGAVNLLIARFDLNIRPWQRVGLQSLGTTVLVWLCFLVLTLKTHGRPALEFYYMIPFYIWIIGVVICSIGELTKHRKLSAQAPERETRPAIYERLKPALRSAEIYALSAEDHYVRVHTSKGDELILMRLTDAVKETSPLAGLSTHRSWWVAENGVVSSQNTNGKISLKLKTDVTAPVSRNKAPAVRQAGWI